MGSTQTSYIVIILLVYIIILNIFVTILKDSLYDFTKLVRLQLYHFYLEIMSFDDQQANVM